MFRTYTGRQRGATLVHWLVALIPIMGMALFAVDLNDLYVAHTELQKAADAGALEGVRQLYVDSGGGTLSINTAVGQCAGTPGAPCDCAAFSPLDPACDAASANFSQGNAVEVVSTTRGHWTFMSPGDAASIDHLGIERGGVFVPNSNPLSAPLVYLHAASGYSAGAFRPIVDLSITGPPSVPNCDGEATCSGSGTCEVNVATSDLNRDTCSVNSVQVCVGRNVSPVLSFFAKLLGAGPFTSGACAVAYLGFSSTVTEDSLDAPIAMCQNKINVGGEYKCTIATFTPTSDSSVNPQETAQWVNYEDCDGTSVSNSGEVRLVNTMNCPVTGHNPQLAIGTSLGVNNGELTPTTDALRTKWLGCNDLDISGDNCPDKPWLLRLPRIECLNPDGTAIPGGQCKTLLGSVTIQLLFVSDHPAKTDGFCGLPTRMLDVSTLAPDGTITKVNWDINYPDGGAHAGPDGVTRDYVVVKTRFNTGLNGIHDSFAAQEWTTCDSLDPADQAQCAAGNNTVIYTDKNPSNYTTDKQTWDAFVTAFNMQIVPGTMAWWKDGSGNTYKTSTFYFAPYCEASQGGGTGGPNFGVLSEVPVLVY